MSHNSSALDEFTKMVSPVSWGCRIRQLHLCRGANPPPHECSKYDIKQSDDEAPILEIWGMQNTSSLPLLPSPLWPRVVSPDMLLCTGQIEQTVCKQMADVKL